MARIRVHALFHKERRGFRRVSFMDGSCNDLTVGLAGALLGGGMGEKDGLPEISAEIMDTQEEKLRKSVLIFASAFMTFAVMLCLAIYWMMGIDFSSNVPLGYQAISVASLAYYMKTRNFKLLRFVQLNL